METYRAHQDERDDKIGLTRFLEALDAAPYQLRFDECRCWRIKGQRGHVYTYAKGVYSLYLQCHSAKAWTYAKKRLSFCEVAQNGDEEGVFRLARLPSMEEAEEIRELLRIRRRVKLSEEELQRRGELLAKARLVRREMEDVT
jgi:hypothetical protein